MAASEQSIWRNPETGVEIMLQYVSSDWASELAHIRTADGEYHHIELGYGGDSRETVAKILPFLGFKLEQSIIDTGAPKET